MKIKKYLRRFVPVSRTYVDAKIKDLESTYTNQIEKQSALFNQLTNYQSASFDEIIQQLSSLETHITKQQQNNIQNLLHQPYMNILTGNLSAGIDGRQCRLKINVLLAGVQSG